MTIRHHGLRGALTGAFALAGMTAALFCSAQPGTVLVNSNAHPTSDTDWGDTFTVAPFNSNLGTLTSVTITLNWNTVVGISAVNNDVSDEHIFGTDQTTVSIVLPNGNPALTGASPTVTVGSLGTNAFGRIVPAGPLPIGASTSAGPISTSSTTTITVTDAVDLATFSGASPISFAGGTTVVVDERESGGNTSWSTVTQAGASVSVLYTYAPTSTTNPPPPGGPITTFTQGGWGSAPRGMNAGYFLAKYFSTACQSGISIGSTNCYHFTSAAAIEAFLPQGGAAKALPAVQATDPKGKGSVVYGQLLAVKLALAFSGTVFQSGLGGMTVQSGPFAGCSVSLVASIGDAMLGAGTLPVGTPPGVSIGDLNTCLDGINNSFDNGTVNTGFIK